MQTGSGIDQAGVPCSPVGPEPALSQPLVVPTTCSEARYHPTNVGQIYGRYKRAGRTEMDESFFPVLWTEDGYRSAFLDNYFGAVPDAAS